MVDLIQKMLELADVNQNQKVIIALGIGLIVLAWLSYEQAQKHHDNHLKAKRQTLDRLYSPALGLLRAKTSGRINDTEFVEKFLPLVTENRSMGGDDVRVLLDKWLDGEANEAEIQALLEVHVGRLHATVNRELDPPTRILITLRWLVWTSYSVFTVSLAIPILLWVLIWALSRLNWSMAVVTGLLLLGTFFGIILLIRTRRRKLIQHRAREIRLQTLHRPRISPGSSDLRHGGPS